MVFRTREETQPFKGVVQRVEAQGLRIISDALKNHLQGGRSKSRGESRGVRAANQPAAGGCGQQREVSRIRPRDQGDDAIVVERADRAEAKARKRLQSKNLNNISPAIESRVKILRFVDLVVAVWKQGNLSYGRYSARHSR